MPDQQSNYIQRAYRSRMRWAILLALLVHAALLLLPAGLPTKGTRLLPASQKQRPIVVDLHPDERPKRLIEPGAPTDQPVDPSTDLIAERASKAQDLSAHDGSGITPDAGTVGVTDDIVNAEAAKPAPKPVPAAEDAAPAPAKGPEEKPKPQPEKKAPPVAVVKPLEEVKKSESEAPKVEEKPQDAAIRLAKAETPQTTQHVLGKTESRVEGGVKSNGFLSFEAMQSDFAPYLRTVRDRVERRWKAMMHVKYSGSSSTQAVLDCAIGPDGTLDHVTIVDSGDSATFAGLCKQAIEQAGPFGKFPFKVPEMYQDKNVEIRWTFTFL